MDKKDKEIMDLKLRIQQLEESMNIRIINNDLCIGISTDSIIIGYARIVNGQVELNDVLATDVKLYNSNLLPEYLVKITCLHSEIYVDMGNDYDLLSDGSELFTVIEGIEYYIKDN